MILWGGVVETLRFARNPARNHAVVRGRRRKAPSGRSRPVCSPSEVGRSSLRCRLHGTSRSESRGARLSLGRHEGFGRSRDRRVGSGLRGGMQEITPIHFDAAGTYRGGRSPMSTPRYWGELRAECAVLAGGAAVEGAALPVRVRRVTYRPGDVGILSLLTFRA